MRRKPYLWVYDPDPVARGILWTWVILVSSVSVLFLFLGSLGISVRLYGGGFFFIGLGVFIGLVCWWAAKDDWTLDEREAI
jgi:hypothetical protein